MYRGPAGSLSTGRIITNVGIHRSNITDQGTKQPWGVVCRLENDGNEASALLGDLRRYGLVGVHVLLGSHKA